MAGFVRLVRLQVVIATAAGLFMSFVGAFGSGQAPLLPRTAYWLAVMWAGSGLGVTASWALERLRSFEERPVATAIAVALVMTAPMTLFVWLMTAWIFRQPLTTQTLLRAVIPVFLVSAVVTGISYMARRRLTETHAGTPEAPITPRFLDRLPFRLKGSEIYAVQAEDHYLRVHTSAGSDLILMRLSDAVGALEGIEGAQTHRSWWVSKGAVADVRTSDGRATLTLKSGAEVPVSRTYNKALRQAGWW
jgi:DNA-binding LytR/AlgR family response regulator